LTGWCIVTSGRNMGVLFISLIIICNKEESTLCEEIMCWSQGMQMSLKHRHDIWEKNQMKRDCIDVLARSGRGILIHWSCHPFYNYIQLHIMYKKKNTYHT
jgi:hypothetical protein